MNKNSNLLKAYQNRKTIKIEKYNVLSQRKYFLFMYVKNIQKTSFVLRECLKDGVYLLNVQNCKNTSLKNLNCFFKR